ncbi:MAG: gliding motility-associated C-terminal domain-containing protein, partial [Bacteroidia bacterium]
IYLAGVIRRDILVIVTSSNGNNNPVINTEDEYYLCVGQPFSHSITYQDLNPITNLTSGDSVFVQAESSLNGLSITSDQTNTAPFIETTLSITPTLSDIGKHTVKIRALDNHCSEYGETYKTIVLNVRPKPSVSLNIAEEFCGNNVLSISSDRNLSLDLQVSSNDQIIYTNHILSPFVYQNGSEGLLEYKIRYTDDLGCIDSIVQDKQNIGKSNIKEATLLGSNEYCHGDSAMLSLSLDEHTITQTVWNQGSSILNSLEYKDSARNGTLRYRYTVSNEQNYSCELEDSIDITVKHGPPIVLAETPSFCFSRELDLVDIMVTPLNGEWLLNDLPIASKLLDLSRLVQNQDTSVILSYSVSEAGNSCISSKEINIEILESPELELAAQQICGDLGRYQLTNSVQRPFNKYNANLKWNPLNNSEYFIGPPTNSIDIENGGQGIYDYECTYELANGCTDKDTTHVTVNPNLDLSYNGKTTLCQGDQNIKLPDYFDVNIDGGIWQIKDEFSFSGDEFAPSECENVTFQYFYHKNGCHSEIEIPVTTVCRPTFNLSIPTEVCKDYSVIQLDPDFNWSWNNQKISTIAPSTLELGDYNLISEKQKDGCTFDTTLLTSIISPLTFEIQDIAVQLCEGDELNLNIETGSKARFTGQFCEDEAVISNLNQIIYSPKKCDLLSKQIEGTIMSEYNNYCPSHSKNFQIPYHAKPMMDFEQELEGCEPYNLTTELKEIEEKNTEIDYVLESDNSQLKGTGARLNFNGLSLGNYGLSLELKDKYGCNNTQSISNFVVVHEKPQADFSMENKERLSLSERELILFNYSTIEKGELGSSWFYGKSNQNVLFSTNHNPSFKMPADTGLFTISLVAKSSHNCKDTATSQVLLVPDIIAFIPSAFTPDNKGPHENSTFKVSSDHASSFYMDIFNKWGQKVFNSTNIEEAWDGTYRGKYCQNGVYLYSIKLINESGVEYTYQGTVNLIR